jgi:hypothetical protein
MTDNDTTTPPDPHQPHDPYDPLPAAPEAAPAALPPSPDPLPRQLPRGALGAWWLQGFRTALLMRADWTGLQATPAIVACLFLLPFGLAVLLERLVVVGAASFYWPTLLSSRWAGTVLLILACWLLMRGPRGSGASGDTGEKDTASPDTAALFAMLCAQGLPTMLMLALLFVPMARGGAYGGGAGNSTEMAWLAWGTWWLAFGWLLLMQATLLWRAGTRLAPRLGALLMVAAALVTNQWLNRGAYWYPARAETAEGEDDAVPRFKLTQELVEQQSQLLQARLQALAPQRKGTIDVYTLTFAPNAEEEVFRRESAMVADVMTTRFDSAGRALQLVSHHDDPASFAWATPVNLQRAITRMAALMDRDEDVLFLHLTSHGARDGQLASSFWPLEVDSVTPAMLKGWLDAAGIRHRVISVSACYSGSWIAPLSDPDTLVMTAADADHTSYGCGRRSPLTFFGRAMYDEGMRTTWSFEEAHAAARTRIEQREKEAGKTDGYSNPQIAVGERMRETLAALAKQRAAAAGQ